jgi:threonylcarbamoyladenosine tRNA methylthiotransferase MtaB
MIRVALHTLGCRTNQADSAAIRSELERAGEAVEFVPWNEPADVYVLNTCTVTARADRDGRKRIHQAGRARPGAPIVVFGCYAEIASAQIAALSGVAAVIGNRRRDLVAPTILAAARGEQAGSTPPVHVGEMERARTVQTHRIDGFPGRVRAMLKIQEGCDRHCAYCVVPAVRGPSRSVPVEQVVEDALRLADARHPEIVLTGTHIGGYGRELRPACDLAELLDRLLRGVPGVRFRISSVDPEEITDALIHRLATDERVCRHLHLAVQHGDGGVLRAMRRASTPGTIRRGIELLAERVPGIAIGADVIAGFPTEDDDAFERGTALLRDLPLTYLHVFGFSPRPGTPAAQLPGLPGEVISARVAALRALSEEQLRPRFLAGLVGQTLEVVVERADAEGLLRGTSSEFATVQFPGSPDEVGSLVRVEPITVRDRICQGQRMDGTPETGC